MTAIIDMLDRTEPQQRAMLRLSLGDQPHELPLRQGRAIGWLREALEPLSDDLGEEAVQRLAIALRSVCGIETRVWLTDIAGQSADEVRALQLWMVGALLARAADEPPPSPRLRQEPAACPACGCDVRMLRRVGVRWNQLIERD